MNNILFNAFLLLWTFLYGVIALPCLLLPSNLAIYICKPWTYIILQGLRFFCGVTYEVRGEENIPKEGSIVFMSKHHSTLDTLLLAYLVKKPVYVLKKELLRMPLVGFYLMTTGMIPIDSKSYSLSFRNMVKTVKERLNAGRNIIIFPEGQRVGIRENSKYQRGISVVYNDNMHDVSFIPVALNCGVFWPFGAFDKKVPGNVVIKFLPTMKHSLSKEEFMSDLEKIIEEESSKLVEEGLKQREQIESGCSLSLKKAADEESS